MTVQTENHTHASAFSTVLIPLDGSDRAESVFSRAGELLREAQVVLLAIVDPVPLRDAGGPRAVEEAQRRAADYLDLAATRIPSCASVVTEVRAGEPSEMIIAAANDHDASLIAMATHGWDGMARLFYGSTAEHVLRHTDRPVLMYKSHQRTDTPPMAAATRRVSSPMRRVAVPLDGTAHSEAALATAAAVARHADATIDLVRVSHALPAVAFYYGPIPEVMRDTRAEQSYVDAHVEGLRREGLPAEGRVLTGQIAPTLVDHFVEHPVDLIVMTSHGRLGVRRFAFGSIAEELVRHLHTPVLVLKATDLES